MDVIKKKKLLTGKQIVAVVMAIAFAISMKYFVETHLDTTYTPGDNPFKIELKEEY